MLTRFSPILIVDDSATARRIVRQMSESLGFVNLDEARDGSDALAKLEKRVYSLIISDLFMEPMSGLQLLLKLRASERWERLPFVMMTARTQRRLFEVARDSGATHYLAKPFDAAELKAKILSAVAESLCGKSPHFQRPPSSATRPAHPGL